MKKILVSGIKPTGRPHIGNYLGAMRQFTLLQEEYDSRIFIANLHALTGTKDRDLLNTQTLDIAIDYLAIGLDPEKVTLFKQSDIPEVTELAWIFNTITTIPYLQRAHAYKDAVNKGDEINVGTFDYPILMAADILIQDADIVPVGLDQKQHIEIARDTAEKFNSTFGETFKLPEELINKDTEVVPGIDGKKMSKSYGNTIPLFAREEEIEKAVMSIPTDSKEVDEPKETEGDTLYTLHSLFTKNMDKINEGYEKGGLSYKESKDILIESINDMISPLREKRFEIEKDLDMVEDVLHKGGVKVKEEVIRKMEIVRKKVGI